MENIEQKQDDACEHNGCVGHPITNMLMGGVEAARERLSESVCYGDMITQEIVDDVETLTAATVAAGDAYVPEPDALGDELPAEVLAGVEAVFEEMADKVETMVRQVSDTDERTAHLVITCERLARGQVDMQAKLDRIINHCKVA